jgi:hypothetical protein
MSRFSYTNLSSFAYSPLGFLLHNPFVFMLALANYSCFQRPALFLLIRSLKIFVFSPCPPTTDCTCVFPRNFACSPLWSSSFPCTVFPISPDGGNPTKVGLTVQQEKQFPVSDIQCVTGPPLYFCVLTIKLPYIICSADEI